MKTKQICLKPSPDLSSLNNGLKCRKPVFWCATRQVDKLNNENFFFPGTVYVPGYLCNVF